MACIKRVLLEYGGDTNPAWWTREKHHMESQTKESGRLLQPGKDKK